MSSPRLVTVVLEVADLDRSVAFYRDVVGLDLHTGDHGGEDRWTSGPHAATSWEEGAFLHFALYLARPGGAPTAAAQVAFAVTDLAGSHAVALAAGCVVEHPPKAQPWGRSARYRDPDGNVVELTQRGG